MTRSNFGPVLRAALLASTILSTPALAGTMSIDTGNGTINGSATSYNGTAFTVSPSANSRSR